MQRGAGRQLYLIVLIKIRTNPTVWSYGRSADRTPSAGNGKWCGSGVCMANTVFHTRFHENMWCWVLCMAAFL